MTYTIALAGNPNSGKTTLFNALTGANAYVGNWPGVTVEKKEGLILGHPEMKLVDLPGIYSLSPYTEDERVARKYLMEECPDAIINIVDASNLERNLYLTTYLLEMGIPMVIACNMKDILEKEGALLSVNVLAEKLGAPVVEISALRGEGLEALLAQVLHVVVHNHKPLFHFPYEKEIQLAMDKIEGAWINRTMKEEGSDPYRKISPQFMAVKFFTRDPEICEEIPLSPFIDQTIHKVEEAYDDDSEALMTMARYRYLTEIMNEVMEKKTDPEESWTEKLDGLFINRWIGIPVFLLVIFGVYWLSVSPLGPGKQISDFLDQVIIGQWIKSKVAAILRTAGACGWIKSLLLDGIISGVGAVVSFLPQMMILFFFLSILEQCGYMARAAFILDGLFRKLGLSGKSFIPMLIGTGCSVPAIMASRTIENENDRRLTVMTASFMPCGAKLPIIAFFAGAFFPSRWWFAPLFYFIGIGAIVLSGILLKKTRTFRGEPAPLLIELPNYRVPSMKNVGRTVWIRSKAFLKKATTIILLSSVILWALLYFGYGPSGFGPVGTAVEDSFLARVGGLFTGVFKPLGFGSWPAIAASFAGLVAKENLMSILGIIFNMGDKASTLGPGTVAEGLFLQYFTASSAISFLLFNLYTVPCVAAVASMSRELGGGKWLAIGIGYQLVFSYSISLIFYQFSQFFQGKGFTWGTLAAAFFLGIWLYLLFRPQAGKRILGAKPGDEKKK